MADKKCDDLPLEDMQTEDEIELIYEPKETPHVAGPAVEDVEMKWDKEVYQGDNMTQLTLRAAIMGAFMSLSNLYISLKIG
ncbi:MAG: hypothetical protein A2X32_10005 [Elusimicrobia bacterium GWC2_64_44]|nr:MAG: hypothetical protein A2X32_10005 [Elusimicrobia bacterium GWC2_64_44]